MNPESVKVTLEVISEENSQSSRQDTKEFILLALKRIEQLESQLEANKKIKKKCWCF